MAQVDADVTLIGTRQGPVGGIGRLKRAACVPLVAAMVAAASIGAAALQAQPAAASAYGCSYFGNLGNIRGLPIYHGQECSYLSGQGTYASYVADSWASAGTVCNWNITAEFFDVNGNWYTTINGGVHYGCAYGGSATVWISSWMRPGFECSTLKSNGARITSVCHSLY